jgi:hypothetical protein
MIFNSNNLEMRMLYSAHYAMLRYMSVTVNVYFDEKKEKKRRSSFQLHATWFAYIALLPPKHGTRQTHKTQRKEKTAKKRGKEISSIQSSNSKIGANSQYLVQLVWDF